MGGSPIFELSFGEYLGRALLESQYSSPYAADTAAGWRGDQLFFPKPAANQSRPGTAWESEKQARKFYSTFQMVVERRQRIRLRPEKNGDLLTAETRDRGAFLLQGKGSSTLVLNVVPTGQSAELQERAWKDLEVDFDPAVIRFESAKFADQLSLRKR